MHLGNTPQYLNKKTSTKFSQLAMSAFFTVLLVLSISTSASAQEKTNQKIAMIYAKAYHEQKKLDLAIEVLKTELSKNPKSEELNNYVAELYLEQKKFDRAIAAYEEAAKNAPPEAKEFYDHKKATVTAVKNGTPVPEAPVFLAPPFWSYRGSLKLGYDDNVLQYSESSLATTSQSDTASAGISPEFVLNYNQQRAQGELNASLNINSQLYQNEKVKAYESINLSQTTGFSFFDPGRWGLLHSFTNTLSTSFVDSNNFKQQSISNNFGWQGRKEINSERSVNWGGDLRYQYFIQPSGADADDNRTGLAVKPNVTLNLQFKRFSLSAGAAYERLFAEGKNFQSDTFTIPLSGQVPFEKIMMNYGVTYNYINYPQSKNERSDGSVGANLGLQKQLAEKTQGFLDYSYSKNNSTLIDATYNRHNIEAKVTHEF